MTASTHIAPQQSLPKISVNTLGLMFLAGFVATIAFDVWGQMISPALGLPALSPHGLARSLLGTLGLPNSNFAGYFVHFHLVGLIGYPIGYVFVLRPVWSLITGGAGGWLVAATIYGFGLWVVAIGGITTIAGLPFFLGFTKITWVALVGHVLYGIAFGAVWQAIARRAD